MFLGAIPRQLCEQLVRVLPFAAWQDVFVCCSGSFRVDQAIHRAAPEARIHGNDVSLYSTVIGRLATKEPFALTFTDRLAFVEDHFAAQGGGTFQARCAAVLLAHEMSRYARKNAYAEKHFAYYVAAFPDLLAQTEGKLVKLVQELTVASYFCGDLSVHLDRAIALHQSGQPAGVAMFPPFFLGDYEQQYKFLGGCIQWDEPEYPLYDPKTLDALLLRLEEAGIPYFSVSDQLWDHRRPKLEYVAGRKKPHYGYYSAGRASVRHLTNKPQPFRYKPVDPAELHQGGLVSVVKAEAKHMNFLKDVYLAKGIVHSTGLVNYLLYIDGMLVGGLIYALQKYGATKHGIYLLSDVCITGERRLSKLVAQIATSRALIREVEIKVMGRIHVVITTARSKNPSSMKYRDIYELHSRRPSTEPGEEGMNILQYHSEVRPETPQQMYDEWYRKDQAAALPQKGRRRGRNS